VYLCVYVCVCVGFFCPKFAKLFEVDLRIKAGMVSGRIYFGAGSRNPLCQYK